MNNIGLQSKNVNLNLSRTNTIHQIWHYLFPKTMKELTGRHVDDVMSAKDN